MKTLLRKAQRARFLLREAYVLPRAGADRRIHGAMAAAAEMRRQQRRGFQAYLSDHPPLAKIEVCKDWHVGEDGTNRLEYANSLFAPGVLCVNRNDADDGILIALPGFHTGGSQILAESRHDHYLGDFAAANGLGLAAWDWPLQGARLKACLYHGLASIYSAEREYSRILPALGTSLWREFTAEFAFALGQIRRLVGPKPALHVMGWSMGGSFAYYAPLLGTDIATAIAAGSCAAIQDLFHEHQARIHGFFFYTHDSLDYFDLDDIVADVSTSGTRLLVIHGDQDPGCLPETRDRLRRRIAEVESQWAQIILLENHGHVLSDAMKNRCSQYFAATA